MKNLTEFLNKSSILTEAKKNEYIQPIKTQIYIGFEFKKGVINDINGNNISNAIASSIADLKKQISQMTFDEMANCKIDVFFDVTINDMLKEVCIEIDTNKGTIFVKNSTLIKLGEQKLPVTEWLDYEGFSKYIENYINTTFKSFIPPQCSLVYKREMIDSIVRAY